MASTPPVSPKLAPQRTHALQFEQSLAEQQQQRVVSPPAQQHAFTAATHCAGSTHRAAMLHTSSSTVFVKASLPATAAAAAATETSTVVAVTAASAFAATTATTNNSPTAAAATASTATAAIAAAAAAVETTAVTATAAASFGATASTATMSTATTTTRAAADDLAACAPETVNAANAGTLPLSPEMPTASPTTRRNTIFGGGPLPVADCCPHNGTEASQVLNLVGSSTPPLPATPTVSSTASPTITHQCWTGACLPASGGTKSPIFTSPTSPVSPSSSPSPHESPILPPSTASAGFTPVTLPTPANRQLTVGQRAHLFRGLSARVLSSELASSPGQVSTLALALGGKHNAIVGDNAAACSLPASQFHGWDLDTERKASNSAPAPVHPEILAATPSEATRPHALTNDPSRLSADAVPIAPGSLPHRRRKTGAQKDRLKLVELYRRYSHSFDAPVNSPPAEAQPPAANVCSAPALPNPSSRQSQHSASIGRHMLTLAHSAASTPKKILKKGEQKGFAYAAKKNIEVGKSEKEAREWYTRWNKKLKAYLPPEDSTQNASPEAVVPDRILVGKITKHIRLIVKMERHPLCDQLNRGLAECSTTINAATCVGAHETAMQIMETVTHHVDHMTHIMSALYSSMTPPAQVAARHALYHIIFAEENAVLFLKYESKFEVEDKILADKCEEFATINMAHLGLPRRFWLVPRGGEDTPPYLEAILIARTLPDFSSPIAKAKVLVAIGGAIGRCIQQYWKADTEHNLPPDSLLLGADDFLPIYAFVLLRAKISRAHSQGKYMEHFLDESSMAGELGYAVVTYQTSLIFIKCLKQQDFVHGDNEVADWLTEGHRVVSRLVQDTAQK
eukprot:TRINITY_DN1865_c0_g1_i1.p1 TRINITY_DN1865_c0_g1~~TRINITY_DN1865_c0_g1_i1.p1  ORF type:complete len:855 (-),score=134.91 TRINITY_DN1865_c0_g1_i1:68-2632(-)